MTRRNFLLLVLALECVYVAWVYWPEPKPEPEFDASNLTLEQLIEELDGDNGWHCAAAIAERGWREGPQAIEPVLTHPSSSVRGTIAWFTFVPPSAAIVPDRVEQWRKRLLRMLATDPEGDVRRATALALSFWVHDGLIAAPRELLQTVQGMLTSADDAARSQGALAAFYLRDQAAPLLKEILALDCSHEDGDSWIRYTRLVSLGAMQRPTARVMATLLDGLTDNDESVRTGALNGLAELGRATPDVVASIADRWRAPNETAGIRHMALHVLAQLPLPPRVAAQFANESLHGWTFADSDFGGVGRWVAAITNLAVRSANDGVRSDVTQAVAHVLRDEDFYRDQLVYGAVVRLAASQRDPKLLARALQPMLQDLFSDYPDSRFDDGLFRDRLHYEALVDVCLWHDDAVLTPRVRWLLEDIAREAHYGDRTWSREQLDRLPRPR